MSCKCSYVLSFSLTFDCDNVSIVLGNGILGEIGITKLAKQNNSRTCISLKSRKKIEKEKRQSDDFFTAKISTWLEGGGGSQWSVVKVSWWPLLMTYAHEIFPLHFRIYESKIQNPEDPVSWTFSSVSLEPQKYLTKWFMWYHWPSRDTCTTKMSHQLNSWDIIDYHLSSLIIIDYLKIRKRWITDWLTDWLTTRNQEMLAHLKTLTPIGHNLYRPKVLSLFHH